MTAADLAHTVRAEMGSSWLPQIYRDRVLKMRTRGYQFPSLKPMSVVQIQHTLLGVELKIGSRRLLCPDLATARYLAVFARAGCAAVAVPYDITKVSQLADELESSWHRMFLLALHKAAESSERMKRRICGLLIAQVRTEVESAGAGALVPEFKKSTRQRL